MKKISEKCKNYLKWANFTLGQNTPRYKKRLYADFFTILAYAIISSIMIWMQKADMIVLLLNIFCLLRVLIKNTIKSAETTKSRCKIVKKATKNEKNENYSHYHIRTIVISVIFTMTVAIYIALFKEPSGVITKLLATISIFAVYYNDADDIIIYAYDANI